MKSKVINPVGNWSFWTEAQKSELRNSQMSTKVGDMIVYENDEIKVWTIHLPNGERLPFHKHDKFYFWTVLSAGKARSYFDDGSVIEGTYEVGETKYFKDLDKNNYFIHDLENIGDTMLIFSTVEFKQK